MTSPSFHALDELVPVSIWRLVLSEEEGERSIVILKEDHGEALLPIAVGYCEAASIKQLLDDKMDGRLAPRPMTHELLTAAIEGLRGRVERGIITRLDQETFFARLVVGRAASAVPPTANLPDADAANAASNMEVSLDARPSDVICVCLAAGCALYAVRRLLEQVTGEA